MLTDEARTNEDVAYEDVQQQLQFLKQFKKDHQQKLLQAYKQNNMQFQGGNQEAMFFNDAEMEHEDGSEDDDEEGEYNSHLKIEDMNIDELARYKQMMMRAGIQQQFYEEGEQQEDDDDDEY